MIYTVTFNPSLDYLVTVDDFKLGLTNRTSSERLVPGGKGLNVSMVLGTLGLENTAFGFAAGFTGAEIVRRVEEMGVRADFIPVREGFSRINLKLQSIDGTEINGSGPPVDREAVEALMARLAGRKVMTVVDAEKELLVRALKYRPFLVKPNSHELGEIFGREFRTRREAVPYGVKLREMGAENVLVSMAGEGAVLAAGDGSIYESPAPAGRLVSGVGAGDAMVAGFLAGWLSGRDYGRAFRMGIAAGSASAFSQHLATREEIEKIYPACHAAYEPRIP